MSQTRTQDPRELFARPPFDEKPQQNPGAESRMNVKPDYGEQSYRGHGRLEGRVALVTGADSGIGRAVALAFAREGADVAIAYLNEHDDARETQRIVEAAGRRALLLPGDLFEPDTSKRLVDQTVAQLGRIDTLVINAVYQGKKVERFEDIDDERITRSLHVNILAMFKLVRAALAHFKPGATIINVASIQGYDPTPGILDYATTKGAILTFSKGLSQELIKRGIRVNVVAPGPVWTPNIVQSMTPEEITNFGQGTLMGRPAQPVELSPAFVFLASDESTYVNGEILGVTGGQLLP